MKERYRQEVPTWLRALGAWRINTDSIDFNWGYFAPRWGFDLYQGFGYESCERTITICLGWGVWHFKIGKPNPSMSFEDMERRYGFWCTPNTIFFHWGDKLKSWHFPFLSWEFISHEILDKQGEWTNAHGIYGDDRLSIAQSEVHPYTYTLRSGKVQNVGATCTMERWIHHRKWFPWSKRESVSLQVEFSAEVGEGTGSWKGGTVGCGYDILPGESMLDCLCRMKRERKFNR